MWPSHVSQVRIVEDEGVPGNSRCRRNENRNKQAYCESPHRPTPWNEQHILIRWSFGFGN